MATATSTAYEPPRKRQENRVYRRESLIRSAIATVAEYDIVGATVERICYGAGASRGLIAHYFDSKEELLLTAAAETYDQTAMSVKGEIAQDRTVASIQRLKRMAWSSFEEPIYSQDAIAAWQAFNNAARHQTAYMDVIRNVSKHLLEVYEPVFSDAAKEKGIPIDTHAMALGLVIIVDGLWHSLSTGRDHLTIDSAKSVAERYIDGCFV